MIAVCMHYVKYMYGWICVLVLEASRIHLYERKDGT